MNSTQESLPPTTTTQEDLTTAGQRAINMIWETTQARLALGVVLFTILINGLTTILAIVLSVDFTTSAIMGLSFLNLICSGVISFYFSRTNHAAIGGIGRKSNANEPYLGR